MAYAREIFIAIKQKIRFQQADKEADSHYTVLGNTLVRISNHCTWMKIWDNYLQKNPQDAKRNILSLVFEDGEDTYTEECLFTVTERKKPIRVTEYVFKSASLSKQDVKMIIGSLQQMMTTNKFNEPTGKGERFDRISVNPDYMNIETTADRRAIPAGGHGMDYSIEESKTNKNMKKKNYTDYRNFLEGLEKGGILYFYLVSLISSDSLLTVEDCEESLREIDFCLEVLPENDIKDREKIKQMLIDGKEIVLRDLEMFKEEQIKDGDN